MLFVCFALICMARSLLAVELSVYKSFTEVRQLHNGVGDYAYEFSNGEYENIVDGSINWDGTPFVRQEIYNSIESLQGAKVIVKRSSVCECETVEAKIIDPETMLLQNLKTGSYFYADKQSIEYTSTKPNDAKTSLVFQFKDTTTQHNGTLSYLMKGISWKPNYDLFISGNNECKLRSYANIRNDQQREYTVENTYLLGGDVQLASGFLEPAHRFDASKAISSSNLILHGGEQKGLYSYLLKDKYTLRPTSSIRLPFIDVNPKCRFFYKTSTNIAAGNYQGVFEKNYDLTPDHFIPAGTITIRDNHVLVGQANIPDVPENYTQTITVGQDNDVRYSVTGELTSKTNETEKIQLETYQLDVQIMNFKGKQVDTQLVFNGGIQIKLIDTTCKDIKLNGNRLNFPVRLEQGEKRSCKVNLTVRLS